jgi:mRNA interferase MazF
LRPAVILSSDLVGILQLKIVAPITSWQDRYAATPWMVQLMPNGTNNLKAPSAADVFQSRSISHQRFRSQIGAVTNVELAQLERAVIRVFHLDRLFTGTP